MRIGLVTGEYPPMEGGIGAHCRILARTLTAQGHQVFIYSDERAAEPDPDITLTHKPGRWRGRTFRYLNHWAESNHLDVVNLHYQTAAYQMSPWVHFAPGYVKAAPLVTTFHDLRFPYLFPKAGPLRPWIVQRLARRGAGIIATNHEDHMRLSVHPCAAMIPLGSSVATTLPDGYQRADWRRKLGIAPTDTLIAHFGFVNHSKGVDTVLESLAQLVRAGMPVHLLMIGGRTGSSDPTNAVYVQSIDALINTRQIRHHVHWTGFVEDTEVSAYLHAADFVVLPFRDGASYRRSSLMAVIQHARPILTTQPSVPVPTFRSGENLLTVAPENVPALSAAIQVLARDPALRKRLAQGAESLRAAFDWERIAQAHVDFYAQAITGVCKPMEAPQ